MKSKCKTFHNEQRLQAHSRAHDQILLSSQYRQRPKFCKKFQLLLLTERDRGGTVVQMLCYKSVGRWFDPS